MYSNAEVTFRGDETISPVFAELPSRWIQVRSSQVEGGDVLVRLRTRDLCVSKTIPGLWGKKRNEVPAREDPENDTGLFEVGFKSRKKNSVNHEIKRLINTPNWAAGSLLCVQEYGVFVCSRSFSESTMVSLIGFVQLVFHRDSCWVTNNGGTRLFRTEPTASNQPLLQNTSHAAQKQTLQRSFKR